MHVVDRIQPRLTLTLSGVLLVLACVLDDFARLQPDLHRARTISAVSRVSSFDLIYFCLDDALLPRSPSCYANLV